jgi:hypothetical protein
MFIFMKLICYWRQWSVYTNDRVGNSEIVILRDVKANITSYPRYWGKFRSTIHQLDNLLRYIAINHHYSEVNISSNLANCVLPQLPYTHGTKWNRIWWTYPPSARVSNPDIYEYHTGKVCLIILGLPKMTV